MAHSIPKKQKSEPEQTQLRRFWSLIKKEPCKCRNPLIQSLFQDRLCKHEDFRAALAHFLGVKLEDPAFSKTRLMELAGSLYQEHPDLPVMAMEDILAVRERDPACTDLATPFLFHKGWLALQAHRLAHILWEQGEETLALWLQSHVNERFAIDIHPQAKIGRRVTIDHGTGLVIGQTSRVGDDVSLLHGVTLGGISPHVKNSHMSRRHPSLGDGVMVGAGAILLGPIEIGSRAKIGAGSVVLKDVPSEATAVGNPARILSPGDSDWII